MNSSRRPKLIRVVIFPDGFTINDKQVSAAELGSLLDKLAALDKDQTILITCGSLSPHKSLVKVLDLCAGAGLKNLSVLSAN